MGRLGKFLIWAGLATPTAAQPPQVTQPRRFYIPEPLTVEIAKQVDWINGGNDTLENQIHLWRELAALFPEVAVGTWKVKRDGTRLCVEEKLPQCPPPMAWM